MAGVIFDDDGLTTGGALALLAASAAGWVGAPYLGRYAAAAKLAGLAGGAWALFAIASRLKLSGGLGGAVAGVLAPSTPTTTVEAEETGLPPPVVTNPGGAPASEFLNLTGRILSPTDGETLHARKQLTLDGTYPVDLLLRNDRGLSSRGFVRLVTTEDTLFGAATTGGVNSDVMTLPPHSTRRLTINVPAASGRASLGISVHLIASWVQLADARERDLGTIDFLVT